MNQYACSLFFQSRGDPWERFVSNVYASECPRTLACLVAGRDTAKYTKVYISPAIPGNGKPLAIEFREHRGTVEPQEIYWWTRFCGAMLNFAWVTASAGVPFFQGGPWDVSLLEASESLEAIFTAINFEDAGKEFTGGRSWSTKSLKRSSLGRATSE
jgi:hypothetical protein